MMRKIIFIFLLGFNPIVYAQWTSIGKTVNSQHFINLNTVQQSGHYKRAWFKVEYFYNSNMLKENIRSSHALIEFDCREKRYRNLIVQHFRQSDLVGPNVLSNKIDEWQPIAPNTLSEIDLLVVCSS